MRKTYRMQIDTSIQTESKQSRLRSFLHITVVFFFINEEDKLSILKYGEQIGTKFERRETARCRMVQK